jgi:hypothetical protein
MGLPLGFKLVEGIGLAFLGHDVVGERSDEWREKHAKNDASRGKSLGEAGVTEINDGSKENKITLEEIK